MPISIEDAILLVKGVLAKPYELGVKAKKRADGSALQGSVNLDSQTFGAMKLCPDLREAEDFRG